MRLKWSTGIGTQLTLMVLLFPEVKTDMRFTSAHDHTAYAPADPYAAYGGFAAFTAFQQWQGYQQQVQTTQAAGLVHPTQVGINIAREGILLAQVVPGFVVPVVPAVPIVSGAVPPPPLYWNIVQNISLNSDTCDDMSLSSTEFEYQYQQQKPIPSLGH